LQQWHNNPNYVIPAAILLPKCGKGNSCKRPAGDLPKKPFQPVPFILLTKEFSLKRPIECESKDQLEIYQRYTSNHFHSFFSQKNFP